MKKLLPLLTLLTFQFSLLTSPVSAQEVSLVVSPPRTEVIVNPGETVQKNVKVTNNSTDQELILKVHVKNFIVLDDKGTPILVDDTTAGKYLSSPWFTLEKSEIVIPPKTTEQIVVVIEVPKDALPGGHYAGVFFQPVPSRGMTKTVSYTTSQVGSLFAINVPGDIKYDAIVKEFKTSADVFEFGPVDFSATIENQSDTHISPKSSIIVRDMIGRQLADIKLDDVNIFPFTSRTISGTWQNVWGLGRYSATLNAVYTSDLTVSATTYFWIMPYRLIAALLVVVMVLLAIFISIRRHVKHLNDHRDDEIEELKRKIVEMENHKL